MADSNKITKIAIVGAGGHVGKPITESLLSTNTITITALTRPESTSSLPSGVKVVKVDPKDHDALVSALKGHDCLIITIAVTAQSQQEGYIRAAADAGIPWILPNEWGFDSASTNMVNDLGMAERSAGPRKLIDSLGVSSWIVVSTGFWYEWSLSMPHAFGFDFERKEVTLIDEGKAKLSSSSWPQVGRAVAALLSLPVHDEEGPCLEQFRSKWVYTSSFDVSQRDMLASVLRVTGTKEGDWTVKNESSKERFDTAMQEVRQGNMASFVRGMYTRGFFPDEPANSTRWRDGGHNVVLGLKSEENDEYTKKGIERVAEMNEWSKLVHG